MAKLIKLTSRSRRQILNQKGPGTLGCCAARPLALRCEEIMGRGVAMPNSCLLTRARPLWYQRWISSSHKNRSYRGGCFSRGERARMSKHRDVPHHIVSPAPSRQAFQGSASQCEITWKHLSILVRSPFSNINLLSRGTVRTSFNIINTSTSEVIRF